ncbi:MAG: hypothetical protein FD180_1431 [Planctomycetota bacterium]|nr:MAG: hypothetical protein FD180_1431 [Planctomycetota bacterium]
MKIILGQTAGEPCRTPGDGEVLLAPRASDGRKQRQAALTALREGAKGFPCGAGEPASLVVQGVPVLDDMLAAEILVRSAKGEKLPQGIERFAQYAAVCREGLRPGTVSLEASLEGVYLAMLNVTGICYQDGSAGENFLASWARLARAIFAAAEAGIDPSGSSFLAGNPEFSREMAYLRSDRDVFLTDVQRGQRWKVSIPGGPAEAPALYLDCPRSILFKSWARQDNGSPSGACLFLAVRFEKKNWVFSTDPAQRLPLKPLSERLQQAELALGGAPAAADPWFDGAPFTYTLVAAPRAGTRLADTEVLRIARTWLNARSAAPSGSRGKTLAIASTGALLVVVLATAPFWKRGEPKEQGAGPVVAAGDKEPGPVSRGSIASVEEVAKCRADGVNTDGFAVIIGVGASQGTGFQQLEGSVPDAAAFYCLLRERYGFKPEHMRLLVDRRDLAKDADGKALPVFADPTKEQVTTAIQEVGAGTQKYSDDSRTDFVLFFAGHGDTKKLARQNGYLVLSGYDAAKSDLTGFDMGYLSKFLALHIKSSHRLIMTDCCFSGFVITSRGTDLNFDSSAIYKNWGRAAHVLITAGTEQQPAFEENGRSYFTKALLEAVGKELSADTNKDGIVTDEELGSYLKQRVPEIAAKRKLKLNPLHWRDQEHDDMGQFLFIPRGEKR